MVKVSPNTMFVGGYVIAFETRPECFADRLSLSSVFRLYRRFYVPLALSIAFDMMSAELNLKHGTALCDEHYIEDVSAQSIAFPIVILGSTSCRLACQHILKDCPFARIQTILIACNLGRD